MMNTSVWDDGWEVRACALLSLIVSQRLMRLLGTRSSRFPRNGLGCRIDLKGSG